MTNMKNLPHTKPTESMSARRKACRGIAASRLSFNYKNDGSVYGSNSGAFSTILGGSGNTISAAYSYAGVFGQGITASASYAFHANCLITPNTPPGPASFVAGTIYFQTGVLPGALASCKVLMLA